VLLPTLPAPADVIHLKNGRTIWADQIRENKDRVEYDLGEDTYAIPKSAVERIEAGGAAPDDMRSLALDALWGQRVDAVIVLHRIFLKVLLGPIRRRRLLTDAR